MLRSTLSVMNMLIKSQVKVTGKMINKHYEKIMTRTLKVTVHQRKRNIKRRVFNHEGKTILEMNFEEKKIQELVDSYLKTRKRIKILLLKKIINHEQEKAIAEYVRQLYYKKEKIEDDLKFLEAIKSTDELSLWSTKEIRELKKPQGFYFA